MGKINLEILLDNEFAIFYPDQVLGGKIKLTLQDELKVTAINITLHSHANVRWSEGSGNSSRTYSANEKYLDHKVTLLKGEQGQKDIFLPSGTHEYPFKIQLPKELPGSFEGDFGHVRHQLKAHVDRPWALDSRCKRVFTIVNPLDLNKLPDLSTTIGIEKQKNLCCWCCKSDPILATMVVKNRRGYVPGETISFSSEITNKSGRTMKKTKGKLIMEIHYHATNKSRTVTNVLTKAKQGEVKAGGSDSWVDGKLQIPPVPPSFLEYCNIIDIKYFAMMQVVPAGPAISLKVPVEIIIGSIPLKEVADQYNVNLSTAPIPTGAPRDIYSDVNTNNIPSNVPHTMFAESAFGRKSMKEDDDDANTAGTSEFAPVYTYFTWEKPEPASNFTAKP